MIAPEKLTSHFQEHFSPRPVEIQPEVENPHLFPHILPPENLLVNEDLLDEDELLKVIKKQKDDKCQGTDKIFSEHLKYSTSENLVAALLLLLTTIWTLVEVPKSWLEAVITCLHKKGLKSVAKNYRSIFIMNANQGSSLDLLLKDFEIVMKHSSWKINSAFVKTGRPLMPFLLSVKL